MLDKYPNYELINLDCLTYSGNLENLEDIGDNPNYNFIEGNILNIDVIMGIIEDVDYVINFAAESHVDRSIETPSVFAESNILGTQNLLEAGKRGGIEKFIQISADEVYGTLTEGKFREPTPLAPNSPYSASKAGLIY